MLDILIDLQDYMFTSHNMDKYTKHIIKPFEPPKVYCPFLSEEPKKHKPAKINQTNQQHNIHQKTMSLKESKIKESNIKESNKPESSLIKESNKPESSLIKSTPLPKKQDPFYCPKQTDTLFWCFYILKHGFSNYEMEISGKYFTVEKNEKFKYIELLRQNKDKLKIHKIKPYTELEDDLANKDAISIKTFFALCVIENINVILINKRKVYEILCTDDKINVIHKNDASSIEIDPTSDTIKKYRETYYHAENFDASLKSIGSYKLEDLIDLCQKLNLNIEEHRQYNQIKKMTKKHIYDLLTTSF